MEVSKMTNKKKSWRYLLQLPIQPVEAKLYAIGNSQNLSLCNIHCDNVSSKDENLILILSDLLVSLYKPQKYVYAQLLNTFQSVEKLRFFFKRTI
jgi:hypothetical protein